MRVQRLPGNPIIAPGMPGTEGEIGENINGPSLIRVPEWVENPLGSYYLYFAHHRGSTIRLAYADSLTGPWRIHAPGALHLRDSLFTDHIASPDVHIDHENRVFRLYYHGVLTRQDRIAINAANDGHFSTSQRTRAALSADGIHFEPRPEIITSPYLRVFPLKGMTYGLTMPGLLYRSADGLTKFERGPLLFGQPSTFSDPEVTPVRHLAVRVIGEDSFQVFFSRFPDTPERILVSTVDASADDWHNWRASPPEILLEPETDYEGADLPLAASARGKIMSRARQLRDPAIFIEAEQVYLLYNIAGEHGIAIAQIIE